MKTAPPGMRLTTFHVGVQGLRMLNEGLTTKSRGEVSQGFPKGYHFHPPSHAQVIENHRNMVIAKNHSNKLLRKNISTVDRDLKLSPPCTESPHSRSIKHAGKCTHFRITCPCLSLHLKEKTRKDDPPTCDLAAFDIVDIKFASCGTILPMDACMTFTTCTTTLKKNEDGNSGNFA